MSAQKDKYYPKTQKEFDAFIKSMDAANEAIVKGKGKRGSAQSDSKKRGAKK